MPQKRLWKSRLSFQSSLLVLFAPGPSTRTRSIAPRYNFTQPYESPTESKLSIRARISTRKLTLQCACLVFLVCAFHAAKAQSAVDLFNATGVQPFGSYQAGKIDTIDLSSGRPMVNIPLISYPQRGGRLNLGFVLQYHNAATILGGTPGCLPVAFSGGTSCIIFPYDSGFTPVLVGLPSFSAACNTPPNSIGFTGCEGVVNTWDGARHELLPVGATTFRAMDGSGFRIDVSTGFPAVTNFTTVLMDADGTRYTRSGNTFLAEDTNGNQITSDPTNGLVDTMGRHIPGFPIFQVPYPSPPGTGVSGSTLDFNGCSGPLPIVTATLWNPPGINGGTYPLKFCFVLVSETMPPGQFSTQPLTTTATQLQNVVLPDGSKWTFEYAADGSGNLSKITFPTGGTLSYSWVNPTAPQAAIPFQSSGITAPWPIPFALKTRTLDPGTSSVPQTTQYNYSWNFPNCNPCSNTVTDGAGNDTVHTFAFVGSSSAGFRSLETTTQFYQGSKTSGVLLKTNSRNYKVVTATGGTADPIVGQSYVPISDVVTLANGLQTQTEYVYDQGFPLQFGTYDSSGNFLPSCNGSCGIGLYELLETKREYGFGRGGPSTLPLVRTISTPHRALTDPSYLANNLLNLLASNVISDASSNTASSDTYGYDETAPTPSHITIQFDTNPASGVHRGNLTSVSSWLNTTGAAVISKTKWYDTGMVYQDIDPLGNATTHSYDSFYAGAFPTETCNALNQCVSATYDFNTGLLTSFTDENAATQASGGNQGDSNHTTVYEYDNMFRMRSATSPPDVSNGGTSAVTNFNYSFPNTFPVSVERQKSITNAADDVLTTYVDGLGRPYQTQHVTPECMVVVDTSYDSNGRIGSVSNPYCLGTADSDPTYGKTQSFYDTLGRITQITKQDGSILSFLYDQAAASDPDATCTVTSDEAQNLRRTCYDALGRLVEVDEPGAGANSPGAPGKGTINISGSTASFTSSGTKATGSFTVNGVEGAYFMPKHCVPDQNTGLEDCSGPSTTYDSGGVSVTVNGFTSSANYFSSSSAAGLASALAAGFNVAGSPVSASYPGSGSTVTLTANQPGPDYALSQSSFTNNVATFGGPSFSSTLSGSALSGGVFPVTTYDSGKLTVTVDGFQASASYNQSLNNNATTMASSLASALNAAASPVTASPSGSTITLTAKTVGIGTDYAVTGSSTASFTATGTTLGKGANPTGIYAPLVTLYQYDALGNLLCVEQHGGVSGTGCSSPPSSDVTSPWRVRRFTYDSLSRMISSSNPETNTFLSAGSDVVGIAPFFSPTRSNTAYLYDNNGNLLQKTSPAPNQTVDAVQTISYCYDALNRITGKGYSAQSCPLPSPVVTYTYDSGVNGKGHLAGVTDQAGSASYSYDVLARLASETRVINGISKSLSYDYNLNGSLKALHYPSGAVVTYTLDSAGRFTSAVDIANNLNYVTSATYRPDGQMSEFVSGNGATFGGITSAFTYNKRLQPVNIDAVLPTGAKALSLSYDFHLGSGDNGNVWGITNNRDTTRSQTFTYDQLNRLTSAQNAGTNCAATTVNGKTEYWGNNYGYDGWGNLIAKSVTKCSAENMSLTALVNNQLSSYGYDAAGNMTFDPTDNVSATYDAENRIATANTAQGLFTYTYDADGNRVDKSGGGTGTLYWYMTPGIIGESDLSGVMKSEYVLFNGDRVARRDYPSGSVSYFFSDHLKTASVITDSGGNVTAESDYYPWGGELQFVNNDSNHYKFTGKERDTESGLDYFGARYYSNGLGRFITPDWDAKATAVPYAHWADPQTLNLYGYVRGTPETLIDDDGHGINTPDFTSHEAKARMSAAVHADTRTKVTAGLMFLGMASAVVAPEVIPLARNLLGVGLGAAPTVVPVVNEALNGMAPGAPPLLVLPLGFANAEAFSKFSSTLATGLEEAGANDASAFLRGSAVTGQNYRTGAPFDSGRVSDLDIAVVSSSLLRRAKQLGLKLRSGGTRTGPLNAEQLRGLGLDNLASTLSQQAGRPIQIMIYGSQQSLVERGSTYIPFTSSNGGGSY